MPPLSSLLVQREIASERIIEEATRRQTVHGADLATNLLEVAAASEETITALLAESFDLAPAPPGRLDDPDPAVLRLIPGELAYRHGFFPIGVDNGGANLVVATSEPLPPAVAEDLSFVLGMGIRELASPLVRIRQAIAGFYGIPLDRRMLRILARLEGLPDPSPSLVPPPDPARSSRFHSSLQMPSPISVPPPNFGTGIPSSRTRAESDADAEAEGAPTPLGRVQPLPPLPRALEFELDDVEPAERVPIDFAAAANARMSAAGARGSAREAIATRGLASWLRRAVLEEKGRVMLDGLDGPERPARQRRKGPFTAAMAEQELEDALTTDTVLDVYFAFVRQFFAFTFLFTVHGDMAEGRNAAGPGAAQLDATSLGVPLNLPSTLALARARRAPVVAPFASDGLDAEFVRDLGRSPAAEGRSPASAVIPIVVRSRVVALLYGDDGDEAVELSLIGDVIAVTALTAGALERLILRKKLSTHRSPSVLAPPPVGPGSSPPAAAAPTDDAPLAARPGPVELAIAAFGDELLVDDVTQPILNRVIPPPPPSSGTAAALAEGIPPSSISKGIPSSKSPRSIARPPVLPPEIEVGWSVLPPPLVPTSRETLPAGSLPGTVSFDEGDTYAGMGPEFELSGLRYHRTEDEGPRLAPPAAPIGGRPPSDESADAAPEEDMFDPDLWSTSRPPSFRGFQSGAARSADVPPALLARRPLGKAPIPREERDSEPPTRPVPTGMPGDPSAAQEAPRGVRETKAPPIDGSGLLAQVIARGPDSGAAFLKLVESGEQTMPLLMGSFPGPLTVDRNRAGDQLPPASRCGPILELIVAIGRPALPFITARSTSADVEIRFWATQVLGELCFPESATALLPRLFDDDIAVRRAGRRSATALAGEGGAAGAPIIQGLSHMTRNIDEPTRRRVLAIETMGEIRVAAMVPPLISALADPSEDVVDAARRALLFTTRQDFGLDVRQWLDWWGKSSSLHRIEWLIDALMHDEPSIRRAAGDELKHVTREYFGYYDDLPPKERERAQGHYREWWEAEGRARFSELKG